MNTSSAIRPAWCRRVFTGLAVAGLIAIGSSASQAATTVIEDFEGDQTVFDFFTGYTKKIPPFVNGNSGPGDSLWDPETLAKVKRAGDVHGVWNSVGPEVAPHGGKHFLAVNGSLVPPPDDPIIFQKEIPVTHPGVLHTFSLWATSLHDPDPNSQDQFPLVHFHVQFFDKNGNELTGHILSDEYTATEVGVWHELTLEIVAPCDAATVELTIEDHSFEYEANDFGFDDFTVSTPYSIVAGCRPTTNPAGKNIPNAGNNPKSGQNPDGFYQLLAASVCHDAATLKVFVQDSDSDFIAGPFDAGDKVKITQAPGGKPDSKKMAGDIVAHIKLKGDALVIAYDPATGGFSAPSSCLVPPKPK